MNTFEYLDVFVPRGDKKKADKAKYLKHPSTGRTCYCGHVQEDFKDEYAVCFKGAPKEDHPKREDKKS